MSNEVMISVDNLCKSYGSGNTSIKVLQDLSIEVRRGEFLAIMGPSGCGKSTLLHVLGLMTPPDTGKLTIDNKLVPRSENSRMKIRRNTIGFVFQRFNLISSLSGEDNIRISLKVRGKAYDKEVSSILERLGILETAKRKPSKMSIGEQQRVAIARALAHNPSIILADEPTGNLDRRNTENLLDAFRQIHSTGDQTILMITHDPHVASYADRTLYMSDGQLSETEEG